MRKKTEDQKSGTPANEVVIRYRSPGALELRS